MDDDLKWNSHINKLYTVLCRNVGTISRVRYFLNSSHLLLLYNSLFLSHVNYCCFVFCNTFSSHISKIEKLQKRAVRLVDGRERLAHTAPIFKKLKLLKLNDIGNQQMLMLMHRKIKTDLPRLIDELFASARQSRTTRNAQHFEEPFTSKLYKTHTVSWAAPRICNKIMVSMLPVVRTVPISKHIIKQLSKSYFLNQY